MGEYRLKSGQSLPSLGGGSLPNLPKINALKGNTIAPPPQSSKPARPLPSYASLTIPKSGAPAGRSSTLSKVPTKLGATTKPIAADPKVEHKPETKREEKTVDAETVKPDYEGFSQADDAPTEVGSADVLLAAMNGIDSWDEVSSLGENGVLGTQTIAQSFEEIANSLAQCENDDDIDGPTMVTTSPLLDLLDDEGELPSESVEQMHQAVAPSVAEMPASPSVAEMPKVPSVPEIPKSPSVAEMPKVPSVPEIPKSPAIVEMPAAPPIPEVPKTPSVPQMPQAQVPPAEMPQVPASPSVADMPQVPASPSVSEMPQVPPASPSVAEMPQVPPASPSVAEMPQVPPASPSVADMPQVPASPSVADMPQAAAQAQVAQNAAEAEAGDMSNMSDEEQLQAILNSMTPEERLAYETHCFEEQARAAQERMARQKELYEMYGESSPNRTKTPAGLVIGIVVLVLGLLGFVAYLAVSANEPVKDEKAAEDQSQEQGEVPVIAADRADLETYKVSVRIDGATSIFVNGQAVAMGDVDFVKGRKNTIIAYAPHMVPYFATFSADEKVTAPIEAALESDVLYEKGRIDFRFTDAEQGKMRYTARFDGQPLSNFPATVTDVVLGRPHILTIETPSLAKHMHIIWPDDRENTVTIPELKPANMALRGTECTTKKMPASEKNYAFSIKNGNTTSKQPIIATVTPGNMIEYSVAREQRKKLDVAIIPDGFGTLMLDMTLLRKSIGESIVAFRRADKEADYRVCMRRSGEVICPSMDAETTVPSGNDWVFFAVAGTELNAVVLRGTQKQELQSSRKYTFETQLDKNKSFSYRQVGYQSTKKKN